MIIEKVEWEDLKRTLEYFDADEFDVYEGVLLDNYIIHSANKIVINDKHVADYIIAQETIKGSQDSNFKVILTNDINVVEEYEDIFNQ